MYIYYIFQYLNRIFLPYPSLVSARSASIRSDPIAPTLESSILAAWAVSSLLGNLYSSVFFALWGIISSLWITWTSDGRSGTPRGDIRTA